MRSFGLIAMMLGILGFFYCSSRASALEPVPAGKSIGETLDYEAGRWELARYGCGGAAMVGLLLFFASKNN